LVNIELPKLNLSISQSLSIIRW